MNSITLVLTFFLTINSLSATLEDNKLQHLENVVKELQQQHQQQRQEDLKRIESLENELSLHNRQTRSFQGYSRISFTAHLSTDMLRVGNYHTIHFDHVITNNGHAYNSLDGIFRSPVTGTYVFIWTTTNKDQSYMSTELVKNGVRVSRSASDAMDHLDYAVATNFAVINLAVGDEVWIQSGTWHSGQVAGDDLSSFAGWLLD